MASGKGIVLRALRRLIMREATVECVEVVSERFRRLILAGPALRGVSYVPGDKIQVLLPSRDVRTYTPARWNDAVGTTELLVFEHADPTEAPGAAWSRTVAVGDPAPFVGPQRSLRAPLGRPLVLFGDETSFAVALALSATLPVDRLVPVFEVAARREAEDVLTSIGLAATVVERDDADGHLVAVSEALRAELRRQGAALLMTGRAQSIQKLRRLLSLRDAPRPEATKAYWAVGKVGLD